MFCRSVTFAWATLNQMSRSKQKGTLAETAVAQYLQQTWTTVERRALSGLYDKGDIAGIPNIVVEIKNQKSYKFKEWLKETEVERQNAKADFGILVVKPNGVGVSKIDQWWSVLPLADIVKLLIKAGYAEGLSSRPDTGNANLRDL